MRVIDVPEPVFGDYEALVDIIAVGVCSGTDNHLVSGTHFKSVSLPFILGHEGIGRVVKIGKKVKHFKTGDLVTRVLNRLPKGSGFSLYHGAFAERGIVGDALAMKNAGLPEHVWKPFAINKVLPKNFDPIPLTMIITWRETFAFFSRMNPSRGETLIIIGSGGTALSFADHARNLGLAFCVVGSTDKASLFKKAGAASFVSYKNKNISEALRRSECRGADIIIDAVGNDETLNAILPLLSDGDRVGVYGLNSYNNYRIAPNGKDFTYFDGTHYDEASAHEKIISYMKKGALDPWRYLSKKHIYPLEKIEDALRASRERKVIKSVVVI